MREIYLSEGGYIRLLSDMDNSLQKMLVQVHEQIGQLNFPGKFGETVLTNKHLIKFLSHGSFMLCVRICKRQFYCNGMIETNFFNQLFCFCLP